MREHTEAFGELHTLADKELLESLVVVADFVEHVTHQSLKTPR